MRVINYIFQGSNEMSDPQGWFSGFKGRSVGHMGNVSGKEGGFSGV